MPNLNISVLFWGSGIALLLVTAILAMRLYSLRSAGVVPPPAAGAPVVAGNSGMSGAMKFWLILVGILSFSIAIISAYGGWAGLFGLIKPSGSDFTITVWVTGAVILVLFASGVKGYWDEGNPKATKGFAAAIATLSVIFFGVWFIFGEPAIKRGQDDLRQIGDNFANRSAGGSGSGASSTTGAALCGPGKFTEKLLVSATTPVRIDRVFPCKPIIGATGAVDVLVKYNGKGPWKTWSATSADPPQVTGTLMFAEFLLSKSGPAITVRIRHK